MGLIRNIKFNIRSKKTNEEELAAMGKGDD